MNEFEGLLCWKCKKPVEFEIKTRKVSSSESSLEEKYAECLLCHSEISIPGLVDLENIKVNSVNTLFNNGRKVSQHCKNIKS